jgi:hypothetical protein
MQADSLRGSGWPPSTHVLAVAVVRIVIRVESEQNATPWPKTSGWCGAGEQARYAEDFQHGEYIAVGFSDFFPDDLDGTSETELRQRAANPADRTFASQLSAFAYHLDVGDYIIVPLLPRRRRYLVGQVSGPYRHIAPAPASGPHRHAVKWLGEFPREGLSQTATNTLGAIQTIFRPPAAEAELRAQIAGLSPVPRPEDDRPVITTQRQPAQLDIDVAPDGRARIACGYPALAMEQTPRHVDPDEQWRGVSGISVLTGTELQHAAVRTGKERTLTTTLIVRPWAYIGLSEDFFSRLASHRQGKPEWRRALLVRSNATPFSSDDIKYLERRIYDLLLATEEVQLDQTAPRGNLSAQPRNLRHRQVGGLGCVVPLMPECLV